jgi:hypothetical protein
VHSEFFMADPSADKYLNLMCLGLGLKFNAAARTHSKFS